MRGLDPSSAARWALIAICMVVVGAALTYPGLDVAQRVAGIGAVGTLLLALGWWGRLGPPSSD